MLENSKFHIPNTFGIRTWAEIPFLLKEPRGILLVQN